MGSTQITYSVHGERGIGFVAFGVGMRCETLAIANWGGNAQTRAGGSVGWQVGVGVGGGGGVMG